MARKRTPTTPTVTHSPKALTAEPDETQQAAPEIINGREPERIADGDTLAGDLLYGAEAFSRFLGWPLRRTRYQLAQGYIPGLEIGADLHRQQGPASAAFPG